MFGDHFSQEHGFLRVSKISLRKGWIKKIFILKNGKLGGMKRDDIKHYAMWMDGVLKKSYCIHRKKKLNNSKI